MKLNLTKPLIVFDLETTGLDMVKDRIIQISYIKVYPDGTEVRKNQFVNPEKPIPEEVVALTGISNDDVKYAQTFKQLAATFKQEYSVWTVMPQVFRRKPTVYSIMTWTSLLSSPSATTM